MELQLTFANGQLTGAGNDDVGRFLIRGRYDPASRECYWTKSYIGRHDVFYRGFREGKGIWGTWEIMILNHGGFHIWPKGETADEQIAEGEEQLEPVDAIAPQEVMESAEAPSPGHDLLGWRLSTAAAFRKIITDLRKQHSPSLCPLPRRRGVSS